MEKDYTKFKNNAIVYVEGENKIVYILKLSIIDRCFINQFNRKYFCFVQNKSYITIIHINIMRIENMDHS